MLLLHFFTLILSAVIAAPVGEFASVTKLVFAGPPCGGSKASKSSKRISTVAHQSRDTTFPVLKAFNSSKGASSGGTPYIVIFNSSHPEYPHVAEVLARIQLDPDHVDVHTIYNNSGFRGFCASIKSHSIKALNFMDDVAVVEKVGIVSINDAQHRTQATWGIQRISSANTVQGDPDTLDFSYTYDSTLGRGVDLYGIDTGINVNHVVFQNRATMIYPNANAVDDNGHGTHTAGTAGAMVLGVASNANIFGCKTLDATGSGPVNTTIAGIEAAINNHMVRSQQPGFVASVIMMSLSFQVAYGPEQPQMSQGLAMKAAVDSAIAAGIHVTVASGNEGADACYFSPGNNGGDQGGVITVGSVGQSNAVSTFSNVGHCVDVYAPGENVISAYIGGSNIINILSGTSMATPHVAGLIATLMGNNDTLAKDPAAMKAYIKATGLQGAITGSTSLGSGPLVLVNNGEK